MNVPKLRFKEFDGEWKINKIKSIFSIRSSGDLDNKIFSSTKTDSHKFPVFGNSVVSEGLLGYYPHYEESAPALTITGRGVNIGTPFYRVVNFSAVGRLLVLHPLNNQIVPLFFSPVFSNLTIFNETTGVPQLTAPAIGNYKVSFPSLQEQMKIGVFFKLIVKKIQLQQQKIDLLQEQKYSFLNRLFPKKASEEPLLRNLKFDEKWSKVKLAGVVERVKSYSLSRDVEKVEETGMKYVHYGDIHTKTANIIDANSNLPNIALGDYITLEKGDLILADASEDYKGIAEPAILTIQTDYKLVAGLHTIALRPIDIDSFFLYYLFKSSAFKEYGYRIGTGMKVFGITANNVLNFEFMLPSIEEQRFIGDFLKSLDDKIDWQIQKLEVLKNQKQGFMQQMFI